MNPLAGAYAQRILLTVFLASFGIYLLIATLTYTPFDPGWTHVSSDTLQVTNASGVAGAWIADFLYGFLGRAAILLPIFIITEAVQLWWPNSFLSRPFRFAAELFLLMIVATLFSLHLLESADTMGNASGGIIGFEMGRNLLSLAGMWISTIFLVVLFLLMVTFVFGIRWHKTMDAIGKIPMLLQELFYRNVPEREAAADFTLGKQAAEAQSSLNQNELNQDSLNQSELNQAASASLVADQTNDTAFNGDSPAISKPVDHAEQAVPVIQSGQRWSAHQSEQAPAHKQDDLIEATKALLAKTGLMSTTAPAQQSHPANAETQTQTETQGLSRSDVRVAPSFAWQDQSLFDELLSAVPEKTATPAEKAPQPDVIPVLGTPASTKPSIAAQSTTAQSSAQPINVQSGSPVAPATFAPSTTTPGSAFDSADLSGSKPVSNKPQAYSTSDALDLSDNDVDVLDNQENFAEITNPNQDADYQAWFESASISTPTTSTPAAPATHQVAAQVPYDEDIDALISEFATPEDIDKPFDVVKADDFDAPLTDAAGRPMSRAMQVMQHRANLSPLPGLDLLDLPDPNRKVSYTAEQLERLSKLLEIKLQEFNVKATVVEAQPGPVVTRFELELAPGVKASKVTNISRDLARSMSMASVRVVEVIPGKPYIGIEVPNTTREMVRLIELLQTESYRDPSALLSVAMGKDIAGQPVLTDLAKAPHMLVAGTTGSGKSVAVNAMLLSMLLKYTPQQLRLILIDPKQLELANYSDIPHLLTPVVTDMKDAVSALNWSVNEMERRYKLMSFLKVRKIDEFNRKVNESIARGEDLLDPLWKPNDSAVQDRAPRLQALPMIVVVADEFADMIMQVGKKAEELITRLAQKSRAAGIHLMLATQRPSVDVITGLIKANIPTRVALRVNSKIDSRTILDGGGAEDLLGHGDMLFLAPGKIEPERVHGAFISDDEVNRICDAWRERGSPDYVDEILDAFDDDGGSKGFESDGNADPERDPMYDQAVQFVLETRKASASALQRKFSLGYNRAARLIDQMEDQGIISPMGPSGKRDILV